MLDRVRQVAGLALDRKTYHSQMRVETERLTGIAWKLERSQYFTESDDDPAWQAFAAGDWHRSLTVFESERADLRAEAARYTRQCSEFRRLRIVENPVTPYVQWEMQALRIIDECGMPVRVVAADEVRDFECIDSLPEVVVVGRQALFQVCYDDHWAACGARRIDDPEIIRAASAEIAELWAEAEPLASYFSREIAPLPVPAA